MFVCVRACGSRFSPAINFASSIKFASSGLALSPTEPFHQHRLLTVLYQHNTL